jgi:outer membrane protein assembly factor BamB
VFIGLKGSVVALNRATGQQVWMTRLKGTGFVNVVLEDGAVLTSCQGEIFCLEPLTGRNLWHNPLKGFGLGLATIATEHNPGTGSVAVLAEKRRRDEAASAAALRRRQRLKVRPLLCLIIHPHVRKAKRRRM